MAEEADRPRAIEHQVRAEVVVDPNPVVPMDHKGEPEDASAPEVQEQSRTAAKGLLVRYRLPNAVGFNSCIWSMALPSVLATRASILIRPKSQRRTTSGPRRERKGEEITPLPVGPCSRAQMVTTNKGEVVENLGRTKIRTRISRETKTRTTSDHHRLMMELRCPWRFTPIPSVVLMICT